MSQNTFEKIIKEILITHYDINQDFYHKDALLRDLYSDFVLLPYLLQFEKLIGTALNKPIQLHGYISILDATVADVIQHISCNYLLKDIEI